MFDSPKKRYHKRSIKTRQIDFLKMFEESLTLHVKAWVAAKKERCQCCAEKKKETYMRAGGDCVNKG
ncbi:hypothetical protein POVCU2_0094960 [Plasmodium ovale curtisi]|uniref:Uncharacterized protein n=1 Tax=Plasmodium ovale curtisi TaxID=864141 RepID=A0A1A8WQX6_PLAOA|nr:hypothetical protein POVCU2_0094960 [Plasmodium ovale curtisi]